MLKNINQRYRVILASQSPRRRQLLSEIIDHFETVSLDIEESYPDTLNAIEIAEYLSLEKSKAYTIKNENELLITADTIVYIDGEVLGKPHEKNEALKMLRKLNGKTHAVITGVTVRTLKDVITFYDKTEVTFHHLTEEEFIYYVDKHRPYDKAGSYGIQEWIGYVGIEKMEGEFYNVMGLPLHKLYQHLKTIEAQISAPA